MSWGGSRPGAGRKGPRVYTKTISICVKEDTAEKHKRLKAAGVDVRGEFENLLNELDRALAAVPGEHHAAGVRRALIGIGALAPRNRRNAAPEAEGGAE